MSIVGRRRKKRKRTKTPGQLMLWRSGFGYDLVEYVRDSSMYYHCVVINLTGINPGNEACIMEDELTDITQAAYDRYKAFHPRYGKRKRLQF
jgi:hypothetical protein